MEPSGASRERWRDQEGPKDMLKEQSETCKEAQKRPELQKRRGHLPKRRRAWRVVPKTTEEPTWRRREHWSGDLLRDHKSKAKSQQSARGGNHTGEGAGWD